MEKQQNVSTGGIVLPKEVKSESAVNADSMVIYGLPKSGKTTALSKLDNGLIIDTEKGTRFIEGTYVMSLPEDKGPVGKWQWMKEVAAEIRRQGRPYKYVSIDTLTEIDSLSEWQGTWLYMNSTQGKTFNRDQNGKMLKFDDASYESVHSLPNGNGYQYSRSAMIDMLNTLKGLGSVCTIFTCHTLDKMIAKKDVGEVMVKDLSLTGKVKDIVSRNVDAIGHLYNDDGEIKISFVGSENKVGGIRAKHLIGYDGPLQWDKIFI